jgi:uncharacterized protein (TIGR02996 family)
MPEERHFLADIDAQPENRAVRLVYADWLLDRGDSRGELIHIEEEMPTLPVHTDRYWELKSRRNELRPSAKKAWLKRLKYDRTDYEPVFGDVPDGWKERWRLLREFTDRWHGLPMDDVGGPIEDVRGSAIKVGSDLLAAAPPSLREWLAFLRDVEAVDKMYLDNLVNAGGGNPGHEWLDDGEQIRFLDFDGNRENLLADKNHRGNPDPAVDYYDLLHDGPACSFPHLTTFALQCLMSASAWEMERLAVRVTRTKTLTKRLTAEFPVHSTWDDLEIFERTNMIAVLNRNYLFTNDELMLQVMAHLPASLDDIPAFLSKYPSADG